MNPSSSSLSSITTVLLLSFIFLCGFYSKKVYYYYGNQQQQMNHMKTSTTIREEINHYHHNNNNNNDNNDDNINLYYTEQQSTNTTANKDDNNDNGQNHNDIIHNNNEKKTMKEEDENAKTGSTTHMICHKIANELYKYMNPNNNNQNNHNFMIPNPVSIWKYYSLHILNVTSQCMMNKTNHYTIYQDFIIQLMQYITPTRLEQSYKTSPKFNNNDHEQMEHMIHIIYNRYMYVKQQYRNNNNTSNNNINENSTNNIIPRKLNIIVFGGSVPSGTNCLYTPIIILHNNNNTYDDEVMTEEECSWPNRLQHFINNLLLQTIITDNNNNTNTIIDNDIIHVYKVTQGGTSSEYGKNIIDLSLLPNDIPLYNNNIDIIINAYSTNDSNQFIIINNKTATEYNILYKIQDFIRIVLTTFETYNNDDDNNQNNLNTTGTMKNRRRQPLLLLYNDARNYLTINHVMNILSNYYNIGHMSYYDTIRDLVFPNTNETWFSPPLNSGPHSGMGMHIVSSWIISYNILHYITSYCTSHIYENNTKTYFNNNHRHPNDNVDSTNTTTRYKDIPKKRPSALPPYLDLKLHLKDMSTLWEKAEQDRIQQQLDPQIQKKQTSSQCLFACLASKIGNIYNKHMLNDKMNQYITYNDGWDSIFDYNKIGYVPVAGLYSKFIMTFTSTNISSLHTMNIMYMKSYGTKWENSIVNMTIYVTKHHHHNNNTTATVSSNSNDGTVTTPTIKETTTTSVTSELLSGYHNQTMSVTYTTKVPILFSSNDNDTADNNTTIIIQVQFQLISGTTFKITGMALC